MLVVRSEIEQMLPAIGIAQGCDFFPVHRGGNLARRIDCVQIADQGNCDPVITIDLVVAADDDAVLSVVAGAKHGGRIDADAIEVDGGVSGGVHRTKFAVRLFHQERGRGMRVRRCRCQKAEE